MLKHREKFYKFLFSHFLNYYFMFKAPFLLKDVFAESNTFYPLSLAVS